MRQNRGQLRGWTQKKSLYIRDPGGGNKCYVYITNSDKVLEYQYRYGRKTQKKPRSDLVYYCKHNRDENVKCRHKVKITLRGEFFINSSPHHENCPYHNPNWMSLAEGGDGISKSDDGSEKYTQIHSDESEFSHFSSGESAAFEGESDMPIKTLWRPYSFVFLSIFVVFVAIIIWWIKNELDNWDGCYLIQGRNETVFDEIRHHVRVFLPEANCQCQFKIVDYLIIEDTALFEGFLGGLKHPITGDVERKTVCTKKDYSAVCATLRRYFTIKSHPLTFSKWRNIKLIDDSSGWCLRVTNEDWMGNLENLMVNLWTSRRRVSIVMEMLDENGDGKITGSEVTNFFESEKCRSKCSLDPDTIFSKDSFTVE